MLYDYPDERLNSAFRALENAVEELCAEFPYEEDGDIDKIEKYLADNSYNCLIKLLNLKHHVTRVLKDSNFMVDDTDT